MPLNEAVEGLSAHDLLVQLVRERESVLLRDAVLDADAVAYLIEEVLDGVGARLGV